MKVDYFDKPEIKLLKSYGRTLGKLLVCWIVFWLFSRLLGFEASLIQGTHLFAKSFSLCVAGFTFMYYAEYLADHKRLAWSKNKRRVLLSTCMFVLVTFLVLVDWVFVGSLDLDLRNLVAKATVIFFIHAIFCYTRDA